MKAAAPRTPEGHREDRQSQGKEPGISRERRGEAENWAAAGAAIRVRMAELKISVLRLARETGLSQTTIRYLGRPGGSHSRSALVALSAVLRWRYDHLLNVLHGELHKNVLVKPPLEHRLAQVARSEIAPLREEVAALAGTLRAISSKIDQMQAL